MLRRQLGGRALVYAHRGDVEPVQRAVDEDDPRSFREQAGVVVVLAAQVGHLAGDEDHSVHVAVEQHVHVLDLAESGALGRAEDRGVAAVRRARLQRLRDRREDRVLEVRKKQSDHARRGYPSRRDVQQLAHRALDPVPRVVLDGDRAAGDAGSRRHADAGMPGYISERGHVTYLCNTFSGRPPGDLGKNTVEFYRKLRLSLDILRVEDYPPEVGFCHGNENCFISRDRPARPGKRLALGGTSGKDGVSC